MIWVYKKRETNRQTLERRTFESRKLIWGKERGKEQGHKKRNTTRCTSNCIRTCTRRGRKSALSTHSLNSPSLFLTEMSPLILDEAEKDSRSRETVHQTKRRCTLKDKDKTEKSGLRDYFSDYRDNEILKEDCIFRIWKESEDKNKRHPASSLRIYKNLSPPSSLDSCGM